MTPDETRAMLQSSGGWGQVGDQAMTRYMLPSENRRLKCRCGCGGRKTHKGFANGVCLMGGCELSVRRWVRNPMGALRGTTEEQ